MSTTHSNVFAFTRDTTAPPRPQVVFVLEGAISGDRPRVPPLPVSFDVVATSARGEIVVRSILGMSVFAVMMIFPFRSTTAAASSIFLLLFEDVVVVVVVVVDDEVDGD